MGLRHLYHSILCTTCIGMARSEEHTSELQSHSDLVCRLLLEKKKKIPELSVPAYRTGVAELMFMRPLALRGVVRRWLSRRFAFYYSRSSAVALIYSGVWSYLL